MFEETTFAPLPTSNSADVLELQQVAVEFRQEIEHREAFEGYCQWYDETARAHRKELASMQRDIPILDWFLKLRR
ncbi:MAG: hypothetical protein AAFW84_20695 [Cyanobacteria bacterium J06635_15]